MIVPAPGADNGNDYHHGHLRQALIEAATQLVAERGVTALSLREVARRANVSHNAPYSHFKSKAELLAEVASDGFVALVAAIDQEFQKYAPDDSMGRLVGVGAGYLTFAMANPSLFRLMFRPEMTHPSEHPQLKAVEAQAFAKLADVLAECQAKGLVSSDNLFSLSLSCWSTVHGLATLWLDQVVMETPLAAERFDQLAQEVQMRLVASMTLQMNGKPAAT